MPTYEFRDKYGKSYEIEGPAGLSESAAFELFNKAKSGGAAPKSDVVGRAREDLAGLQPGLHLGEDIANFGKRVMMNFGAGAQNVIDAARQIGGGGPSDEQVQTRRALDRELANSITGGPALQTGGELAATMVVPAGGFVRVGQFGAKTLGSLARILTGGAERAAAPVVARGASGTAALDAALAGGAVGALQPTTSNESRTFNTAFGAGGGAVVPGALAGVMWLRNTLAKGGAEARAAQELIDRLGEQGAAEAIVKIRGYGFGPHDAVKNIPMTAAELTQDPRLAMLERRSAVTAPDSWADFRGRQSQARWDSLDGTLNQSGNVGALETARDAATGNLRSKALGTAAQDQWFHVPVSQKLEEILSGGRGANPAVQSISSYVRRELRNGITPERLYEVRKVLVGKVGGPAQIGDELSAAVKSQRATTMEIVGSIDDALNAASGNRWQKYLDKYAKLSGPVDNAKAQAALRDVFTSMAAPMEAGAPKVTGHALGRAVEREGEGRFGQLLDDKTLDALRALRENIRSTEDLQRLVKNAGTSGGGSNTRMDELASLPAAKLRNAIPLTSELTKRADNFTQAALLDALQNPEMFVRVVRAKLEKGQPLKPSEERVLRIVRTASVGMPALAFEQ